MGSGLAGRVYDLATYNGAIVAGGWFSTAGDQVVNCVALWDGSAWQDIGGGVQPGGGGGHVTSLVQHHGALIAGGGFTSAGGVPAFRIARWDGTAWNALGEGMNNWVHALAVYSGDLFAGGQFGSTTDQPGHRIARWDGSSSHAVGGGVNGIVRAMKVVNGDLVIGGSFTEAGGVPVNNIARWDGVAWHAMDDGTNGTVYDLTIFNGDLIAGGHFSSAGGNDAIKRIGRFDGESWHPLGTGVTAPSNAAVIAVTAINGELVAGGTLMAFGELSPAVIARWDGKSWQGLGTGLSDEVYTLLSHNDVLIAGGAFITAGGQTVNRIARWDNCTKPVAPIVVVDPNVKGSPLITDQGYIVTDPTLHALHGEPREGLVADGITPLVLRWEVPGPGYVFYSVFDEFEYSADVGRLSTLGGSEQAAVLTVTVDQLDDGRYMAFAILEAPDDFVRLDNPINQNEPRRPIQIKANFLGSGDQWTASATKQIWLYRPPIVLLHGLLDEPDSWGWSLLTDERFNVAGKQMVHRHDYSYFNEELDVHMHAAAFLDNRQQTRVAIKEVIGWMREKQIAATRADVFGHSMGGLLARLYMLDNIAGWWSTGFLRSDNFYLGDVNRLITVNTPHRGSVIAPLTVNIDNTLTEFGKLGALLGHITRRDTTGGAVRDLRADSPILQTINGVPKARPVPVHAIAGDVAGAKHTAYYSRARQIFMFCAKTPLQAFGGPHDCVVGWASQLGGLIGAHTSGLSGEDGLHWPIISGLDYPTKERIGTSGPSDLAVYLLNSRLDSGLFAHGFPLFFDEPDLPSFTCLPGPVCASYPTWCIVADAILPIGGDGTVKPGDIVEVTVSGSDEFDPKTVIVITADGHFIELEEFPFATSIQIPSNWLGEFTIIAYALDENDHPAESNEIALLVQTDSPIVSLSAQPPTINLESYHASSAIKVIGTFADGEDRDVTNAALGTVYSSSDESIVTVSARGILTAKAVGNAIITASNDGLFDSVQVTVHSAKADWNSDGSVGITDFDAFAACFSSSNDQPDSVAPGYKCQDIFDFNKDGAIDCHDWEVFQTYWTGPPADPPLFAPCDSPLGDLNGDGVVNVTDLLILFASWGACPVANDCAADLNGDGVVNVTDLLILLTNWG